MKLVTLDRGLRSHPGFIYDKDWVIDLVELGEVYPTARLVPGSVKALLNAGFGALELVKRIIDDLAAGKSISLDQLREQGIASSRADCKFLAPVPNGSIVLSTGGSYASHNAEMKDATPEAPNGFIKNRASIIGTGQPIVLPSMAPDMVDWEGEFSCVIGRTCHGVSAKDALDYVAGYTLINDVSARDWVAPFFASRGGHPMDTARRFQLNLTGKQFPTFCPVGPCIATKDELTDPTNVDMTTTVNGQVMQQSNTSELVFSLAEIVSYFSRWYRFVPGDVITTGSPSGVGYSRNPQIFLKAGDTVEVSVAQIGTLRNTVVAESAQSSV